MGWYSTGPKIRPADLDIHELFRRYTPNPVLVIINVKPTEIGLPTKAYLTVEEVSKVPHRLSSLLRAWLRVQRLCGVVRRECRRSALTWLLLCVLYVGWHGVEDGVPAHSL